jgi:hypothetical protein
MHATVRLYRGNSDLADRLAAHADEVKQLIGGVDGFRAYYLVRGDAATASVTVCDDAEGAERTNQMAAEWLRENMPDVAISPPEICAGDVVIDMMPARV